MGHGTVAHQIAEPDSCKHDSDNSKQVLSYEF